jgi:hypothetical protein
VAGMSAAASSAANAGRNAAESLMQDTRSRFIGLVVGFQLSKRRTQKTLEFNEEYVVSYSMENKNLRGRGRASNLNVRADTLSKGGDCGIYFISMPPWQLPVSRITWTRNPNPWINHRLRVRKLMK